MDFKWIKMSKYPCLKKDLKFTNKYGLPDMNHHIEQWSKMAQTHIKHSEITNKVALKETAK